MNTNPDIIVGFGIALVKIDKYNNKFSERIKKIADEIVEEKNR